MPNGIHAMVKRQQTPSIRFGNQQLTGEAQPR